MKTQTGTQTQTQGQATQTQTQGQATQTQTQGQATQTQGQIITPEEQVKALQAMIYKQANTISQLRVELDTMKLDPLKGIRENLMSDDMKQAFNEDDVRDVVRFLNHSANGIKKAHDRLLLKGITDLRPFLKGKSGNAISLMKEGLKFIGEKFAIEKINKV